MPRPTDDDESDDTESESDLRPESYQVSSMALTEDTLEVCLSEATPPPQQQHQRDGGVLDQEDDYDDEEDDIAMAHRGPPMMARGPCVECHAHQQQLQQQQQKHANSCLPPNRQPTFSGWDGGPHPPPRRVHPHEGEGHYHYPPTAQRHAHHPRGGMVRHHHPGHAHHRQHSHMARGKEKERK